MKWLGKALAVLLIWAGMAAIVAAFVCAAVYAELPVSAQSGSQLAIAGASFAAGSLLFLAGQGLREALVAFTPSRVALAAKAATSPVRV